MKINSIIALLIIFISSMIASWIKNKGLKNKKHYLEAMLTAIVATMGFYMMFSDKLSQNIIP